MKSLKSKTRLLVQQIISENLLDANTTLASLITEAEQNRQEDIANSLNEDEGAEGAQGAQGAETVNTDGIDQPDDGSPNLGDSLDSNVEDADAAVSEGQMTEMTNDVVQINCEINQKIIAKLYDKISNLKTTLNAADMDHDTREFITLETKLSYYGNKLEQLQSKTNPAIDQAKVQERITIIQAALKSLEAQIGSSDQVSDVQASNDVQNSDQEETEQEGTGEEEEGSTEGDEGNEGGEEDTEQLGDTAESQANAQTNKGNQEQLPQENA